MEQHHTTRAFERQPDPRDAELTRLRAQLTELQRPADAELVGVAIDAFDNVYEADIKLGATHWTDNREAAMRAVLAAVAPRIRAAEQGANDTGPVFFYERDYYPLSNFSAFTLLWETSKRDGLQRFDTSEAVYHWEKFNGNVPTHEQGTTQRLIREATSAHEAFKIAEQHRHCRRPNWDAEKVDVMRRIIRAKADQHEYVRRKLLATGDRELIENSWRDDFWGWGPNRDGQNMLGKLWMELRATIRAGADDGE